MWQQVIFVEASTAGAGALAGELARLEGLQVVLLTRDTAQYDQHVLSETDEIVECETNDAAQVLSVVQSRSRYSKIVAVTTTADMYVPKPRSLLKGWGYPDLSTRLLVATATSTACGLLWPSVHLSTTCLSILPAAEMKR